MQIANFSDAGVKCNVACEDKGSAVSGGMSVNTGGGWAMLDFYVCRTRVGNSTFVGFNHAVMEQCAHYKAAFESDKDCLCRREF